MAKPTFRERM